ncbi:MAG: UDP-N-acetylmuramoyl-L-alanine--D-glutamate ligase, partial [Elusimicrobiota bacterium]
MKMQIKGKKIGVIGLGKSGISSAKLLKSKGAIILICDKDHNEELKRKAEELQRMNIPVYLGG